MNEEQLTAALVNQFGWTPEQVEVGLASRFRCEYCGKDLIADVCTCGYDYVVEHIVPRAAGGLDDAANRSASCRMCNTLKKDWDPRVVAGHDAARPVLIHAAREYVMAALRAREIRFDGERQAIRLHYQWRADHRL